MDIGGRIERLVEAARATVLPIHPLQIDVLKLIACICMLIDHINTCLYDRASVWAWLIGRLAFPLFGLTFVLTLKAHKATATAKRLFNWAICTQPVYALAFANAGFSPWWAGNILFSFAAVAYFVALSQAPSPANAAKGLAVFAFASIIQAPSSFGAAGLIFLLALYQSVHAVSKVAVISAIVAGWGFVALNPSIISWSAPLLVTWFALLGRCTELRKLQLTLPYPSGWSLKFYSTHLGIVAALTASKSLLT